jgi:vitamin K-dependent gamma-carboxylase
MKNRLLLEVDNAPLIIFRIFFGLLVACESFGAILTGWVYKNFIAPKFTFTHIGLEWIKPLPGYGMYFYFCAMGLLGLMIMAGYKYRLSIIAFTALWTASYLMQKTSYNNHYYLLIVISTMLVFLPANRYASIDAVHNPAIKKFTMPAWCSLVMIAQITIVYVYASLAKFYPDWLNGTFTKILFEEYLTFTNNEGVKNAFYVFIAYAGIAFDLLIVPLFLYKRTRTMALIASVIFHIFNSITLKIGIFPFFALGFVVFFYPSEKIRRLFFKKKPPVVSQAVDTEGKNILYYLFVPFLLLQMLLPLRHYFIEGDVLWTEEGHRLSWRMMLRQRSGNTVFKVVDKKAGLTEFYKSEGAITSKQKFIMDTKPDMIWQMAQKIKKEYNAKGRDVAVYADTWVSINKKPAKMLIDPNVDLATAKWDHIKHNKWILLYDEDGKIVK